MKTYKLPWILSSLYTIVMSAMTILFYDKLPEQIPIHWNIQGAVDNWADKWVIWILAALPLLLMLLFAVIPKIDPHKENYKLHKKAYGTTIIGVNTFMFLIFIVAFLFMLGNDIDVSLLIPGLAGGLFIILGNVMPTVKHNYTLGIKTPWTLADEGVWRKTHQVGGMAFIILGLIILASLLAPGFVRFTILISATLLITIGLFVYSYILFKKTDRKNEEQ